MGRTPWYFGEAQNSYFRMFLPVWGFPKFSEMGLAQMDALDNGKSSEPNGFFENLPKIMERPPKIVEHPPKIVEHPPKIHDLGYPYDFGKPEI